MGGHRQVLRVGHPSSGAPSRAAVPAQGDHAGSGGVLHPEDYSVPTILIVDHDRRFLDMLRRFLVDAGYQVITATDGHTALAEY